MLANTNNSTESECYHFINSTDYLVVDLSLFGASTCIGAVSSLTAIALIQQGKGYKVFIFRLLLYMSVDAFFASLATIVYRLVLDYYRNNSQHEMAKSMTYLLMIYLVYLYTFLLCWLVMYLFLLAVFRVQLKKMKHEAIGLVIAVVIPVGFLWVSQWETKCEHNDNIKFAFLSNIPNFFSTLFSCALIMAVLLTLCKTAQREHTSATAQESCKGDYTTSGFCCSTSNRKCCGFGHLRLSTLHG